ncbi:hypothetical protein Hanom_Chr16g01508721 [Helianthus anomalus]
MLHNYTRFKIHFTKEILAIIPWVADTFTQYIYIVRIKVDCTYTLSHKTYNIRTSKCNIITSPSFIKPNDSVVSSKILSKLSPLHIFSIKKKCTFG